MIPFRVLFAEALGTALLVLVVVGSGIMGQRLAGGNAALALLANALATGAGLVVLIHVFAPVSGAHFNPLVTALSPGHLGQRAAVITVQCLAAVAGTLLAHACFDLALIQTSGHVRSGIGQWLSEVIATAGLMVTIRRMPQALVPVGVALWIVAAYWCTASTSFANPAVTLARCLTDTFAGIRPTDVPAFVLAQILGAGLGVLCHRLLGPRP